jgi:hypothetical protein
MYHVSVFVHILSAIVWIGGMFFLTLVVVPATRTMPSHQPGTDQPSLLGRSVAGSWAEGAFGRHLAAACRLVVRRSLPTDGPIGQAWNPSPAVSGARPRI